MRYQSYRYIVPPLIFSIILIYEDNLRIYQVFVLNRQIITD